MSKPLKIFITYAHKDTWAKDELITYLAVLKREGLIDIWHDNEILPGDKWHDAIFSNLADSDILLYLTSAYSLASENCNKELAAALSADTKIRVIPIILDHCDWMNHQLSDFQALPDKGKPIIDSSVWKRESEGWQSVADGIRAVINKMQVQAKPSPSITPEEVEILSELVFQQGNFLMMLEQMDEAIEAYSRAIELNPNDAASYNNRGLAYKEKGEHDCAIEDYTKAIELNPKFAEAYVNRGNAYRETGELNRALEDCNKAIELNPKLTEAYVSRGSAYGAKGEFDCVLEDCNTAIELNPKFADAYSNRGNARCAKGEVDLAIEDCNTALRLEPDHAGAYSNRGVAYCQKGEFDQAIENYTKAIELNPKLAEVYNNRGFTYLLKGDANQAIVDLSKVVQLRPNDAMAYYRRTKVWFVLREWEKAKLDLISANDLGLDIITLFCEEHGSVLEFKWRRGIQLPADIAAMLTPNS